MSVCLGSAVSNRHVVDSVFIDVVLSSDSCEYHNIDRQLLVIFYGFYVDCCIFR